MSGWIKLHRKIDSWEWRKKPNTFSVFMHILTNANFEDGKFMGETIKRGEIVIGRDSLADTLGLTAQSVRTALGHLKSTNEITIRTTSKFSIVTIVNWAIYQGDDEQSTSKSPAQSTSNQPAINHKIRREERKKDIADDARAEKISDVGGQATLRQEPNHVNIGNQIAKITGWDQSPSWFGDYSRIAAWLARGWNPELDIIPTVNRIMAKRQNPEPPQSLKYFEQAIADAHAQRLSPLPEGKPYDQHGNGRNRRYTAEDARRDALAEFGIQDEADCFDGGAMLRDTGHLRLEHAPAQNPHEGHDRRPERIQSGTDTSGFRSLAQITDKNPDPGAYSEPDRENDSGGKPLQSSGFTERFSG